MNKAIRYLVPALFVLTGLVFSGSWFQRPITDVKALWAPPTDGSREAYEAWLANHPLRNREILKSQYGAAYTPPSEAMVQDFFKTMDPALGYPTPERALQVFTDNRTKARAGNPVAKAGPAITWTERGPSSVSGRVRAIMWDPDATNHPNRVWAGGVTGGLWYTDDITASNPTWNKIDEFWESLSITCIAADPTNNQVFYVGTGENFFQSGSGSRGAGIWKTTDGGTTWNRVNGSLAFAYVQDIAVRDESGSGVVYAGVAEYSNDGQSVATANPGLYRSVNGGTSFTEVLPDDAVTPLTDNYPVSDIEIGADNRIYVGTMSDRFGELGGYIFYSDDGTSWTRNDQYEQASTDDFITRIELACAPSNANTVYALVCKFNVVSNIGRSTNKASSFAAVSEPADADPGIDDTDFTRGQAWYDLIMAVDPNNENRVVVGGINLHLTTNANAGASATWSKISDWRDPFFGPFAHSFVHADQHNILFKPGQSNTAIFSNDGGVYYTTSLNTAATSTTAIQSRKENLNITQYYAGSVSDGAAEEFFVAGAQDNGTTQIDDPDASPIAPGVEIWGGDGCFNFISPENDIVIVSYVYNNYYTRTPDLDPNYYYAEIAGVGTGEFINPADADWVNDYLYSAEGTNQIRRSLITLDNDATNSTALNLPSPYTGDASAFRVAPNTTVGNSIVWVGTGTGRLFRVSNAQSASPTVTEFTGPSFPTSNLVSISFGADQNQIIVCFSNYGVSSVWESRNGGTSWTNKDNSSLPDIPVRWAEYNPENYDEVFLATELGVYYTGDITVASPTWDQTAAGFANVRTDMLRIRRSDKSIFAFTHGRGVFSAPLPVVASNDKSKSLLVSVDVYPNPAADHMYVRGELVESSAVTVRMFDLQGRQMLTKNFPPTYSFSDKVSLTGVPKGTYLVRVDAGEATATRRIVVQ